jgi:hypothetical protein
VTFRRLPSAGQDSNVLNGELSRAAIEDGYAALSSTAWGGSTVLRLCTINPRTTPADVERTLERLEALTPLQ